MKSVFSFVIVLLAANYSWSQDVPVLDSTNTITKADLKKKSGWMRITLDSAFQATHDTAKIKLAYYEFVNKKGQYYSTYSKKPPFPKAPKIVYHGPGMPGVLNGMVSLFDEENTVFLQFQFKNGFLVKACDYFEPGKAATLIEYIPQQNKVEMYANYFDETGNIKSDSHEENDGVEYKKLPGKKDIEPISQ